MIFARLKMYAIGVGIFISALLASYFSGRKAADADNEREELEGYVDTRKRMDDVGRMSDADAAREWLRERGKRNGDM